MHSISTNAKSGKTEVTAKKFFFPKLVICGAYFVQLVTMRIFVYVQFSQDPFFDALEEHHMTKTYDILHVFGIIFGSVYLFYFGILTYAAFNIIKYEDDNYRFSIGSTVLTMAISSILMIFNGQVSQRMDVTLFMSLYALFNLYIYFIAYLYAPSLDFSGSMGTG